jgi:hypothetical protein
VKKVATKGKRDGHKKLTAHRRVQDQTKLELIETALAVEKDNHWPEYLLPDQNDDAWVRRKSAVSDLIQKRGGFSHHISTLALTDSQWETKEIVAAWLRKELKTLREAERTPGTAPVRRSEALSRATISDVAIELLECIGGESLVCLFQELLGIDRHRKSLAEDFIQLNNAAQAEAQLELQGAKMGVRAFAKHLSVSPSTVTRWRKSKIFLQQVDFHKCVWDKFLQEEYFSKIRETAPTLSEVECFRRAFQLYSFSIPLRRAGQ